MLCLARSRSELEEHARAAGRTVGLAGLLGRRSMWILWPKKASGFTTDLTAGVVRGAGLAAGLVDFKIVSYDDFWTGLAFSRRRCFPLPRKGD